MSGERGICTLRVNVNMHVCVWGSADCLDVEATALPTPTAASWPLSFSSVFPFSLFFLYYKLLKFMAKRKAGSGKTSHLVTEL